MKQYKNNKIFIACILAILMVLPILDSLMPTKLVSWNYLPTKNENFQLEISFNKQPLWINDTGFDVNSVDISADGQYIVAGNNIGVYLFNRTSSTPLWNYTAGDRVYSVAISEDGNYIAAGSNDGNLYFFNKSSSTPEWTYYTGGWNINTVAISADGFYIVAGSYDTHVRLFNRTSNTTIWSYLSHDVILDVDISANGEYIVAGGQNFNVTLHNNTSSIPIWYYTTEDQVQGVAISDDGMYIIAASGGPTVKINKTYLFNRTSSTPMWNHTPASEPRGVAISGSGEYIATTASLANEAYFFNRNSSTPLWTYTTEDWAWSVAISKSNRQFVLGDWDGNVTLFSVLNSTPQWTFSSAGQIRSVAISADGQYVAAGGLIFGGGEVHLFYNSPPSSNHPGIINTSDKGPETINWSITDNFSDGSYRVWANDTNDNYYIWVDWTGWTNGSNLQVPINRSSLGVFNYTIEYRNDLLIYGIPDMVIVNITPDNIPTSNQPANIITSKSGSETINWTLYDDWGPGQYRVWANDTNDNYYVRVDWTPWINDTEFYISINRSAPGIYNYTIEYNDSVNQFGIPNMVIINITDAPPTSDQPGSIITSATGTETINWTLYDDWGPGQYRVWANDTNDNYYVWVDWTPWINNTVYNVPINRSAPGIYNYTIEYYDSYSQFGVPDMVIVNITNAPPTSNQPANFNTSVSGSETIDWTLYDDFGPSQYRVWVNDTNDNYYVWVDWTPWINNTVFNIPINRSALGIYNYTIEYNDSNNQFGIPNMVIVNITLGAPGDGNGESPLALLLSMIQPETGLIVIILIVGIIAVAVIITVIIYKMKQ